MRDRYLLSELEDKLIDTISDYVSKIKKPYSIVISGGFDSGFLAAVTKPVRGYRIKFPYGTKFDESRYAEAVGKHLDLPIEEIVITPELFRENFEAAVKTYGKVTTHFSLVPLYILMKYLARRGAREVLSGEGPDEYLGGYARQIIFDELKKLYEIPELRNYHELIDKVIGTDILGKYYDLMGYQVTEKNRKEQLKEYPLQGVIGKMDMALGHIEDMEQSLAGHFGIKFHYPMIDQKLAEYCYKLPDSLKIRNGVTKWGFKKIAMKYLPAIMKDRNKLGGPVCPVNKFLNCENTMGDFGKEIYIQKQKDILGLK